MQKKSRALAFVLALVLALSLCPAGLAASDGTYLLAGAGVLAGRLLHHLCLILVRMS